MSDLFVAEAITKLAFEHGRIADALEALVTLMDDKDAREVARGR